MRLDEFLYNLHFDIDQVRPVDVDVNWADAPLPFKLYQGLPAVELSLDVPRQLTDVSTQPDELFRPMDGTSQSGDEPSQISRYESHRANLQTLGHLLWYSYGLTQLCHVQLPLEGGSAKGRDEGQSLMQLMRRYVPSGGGLYPSELYAYIKIDGLAEGVYHYDVAHQRLLLLRKGNYDDYLTRALGHNCNVSATFAVLFVSTMFWKNFYKYRDFSYRLQGLDAGALIGQVLAVSSHCGYGASVHFEFLDAAINHLLGLSEAEESVYAIVPLTFGHARLERSATDRVNESASELCRDVPLLRHQYYVKSGQIEPYPLLIDMNQASMYRTTEDFGKVAKQASEMSQQGERVSVVETDNKTTPKPLISLPTVTPLAYDFAEACRKRYSPGLEFVPGSLDMSQLTTLLMMTLQGKAGTASTVRVALCTYGVAGLPDGAYMYDEETHALDVLRRGDQRRKLQMSMSMPTVNLFQVPLCVHLVGCLGDYKQQLGYRGYRILQMQTGMLLQRLLLAAAALGMNGHPLLGYDGAMCDEVYGLNHKDLTCLIQVPIGFSRKSARFEGPLSR